MPFYDFLNEKTGEIKSLFFHMNEDKKYIDENGIEWIRQFSRPNASIDNKLDENDPKSFVRYTSSRAGSLGELQDLSAELAQKRKDKNGIDIVQEKFYEDYSKKRRGIEHKDVKKRKLKEKIKKSKMFDWAGD